MFLGLFGDNHWFALFIQELRGCCSNSQEDGDHHHLHNKLNQLETFLELLSQIVRLFLLTDFMLNELQSCWEEDSGGCTDEY